MTAALPELDLRELLSCRAIAQYLGVSPRTLHDALYRGELPGVLSGGRWYIRREAALVWAGERLTARGGRPEWRGRPRKVRPSTDQVAPVEEGPVQ